MASYFDEQAELGSEEEDGDFEGAEGAEGERERPQKSNGRFDDSSEEEEDDDEAALAAEAEGFIADEEEDEEEIEARRRRRAERKKQKRKRDDRQEEEEDNLDEEDIDLIEEANPGYAAARQSKPAEPKFKRLKRGRDDRQAATEQGDDFWDDQDDEPRRNDDEMDDFIIEDDPQDAAANEAQKELDEVARVAQGGIQALRANTNLDEDALEDFAKAFGDGDDYDWALSLEEQEDYHKVEGEDGEGAFKPMELKDVFEPTELERKYLTDNDHEIRARDEPERFQIGRKPYRNLVLTEEQSREEAVWISNLLFSQSGLPHNMTRYYQEAIAKVLQFYNVEEYEAPFVFRYRKDWLVHTPNAPSGETDSNEHGDEQKPTKLLGESDLWDVFNHDLKFRAFIERRNTLESTYKALKEATPGLHDPVFEATIAAAETVDELQDIQDYVQFQYTRIPDANGVAVNGTKSTRRRPGASKLAVDKVRNSGVYSLVRAFGISADAFAGNVGGVIGSDPSAQKQYTEDPAELPEIMAQSPEVLSPEFPSASQCMRLARQVYAEELATNPRLRRTLRAEWYKSARFDCVRTEKGLRKIDEQHPFYEFKYLRNQSLADIAQSPGMFLRMLAAETEGLVELQCRMQDPDHLRRRLIKEIESDNLSDVADAWNKERRDALNIALDRINKLMARGVKEALKQSCENKVAQRCRDAYYEKLDQAPWRPKGEPLGTIPRIMALSNGNGIVGRDPLTYVVVEDDGRMLESSKLTDLNLAVPEKGIPDGADVEKFISVLDHHHIDVIAVSGYSTETLKLYRQLVDIISTKNVLGNEFQKDGDEDGVMTRDQIDVIIVNDEVARLYKDSDRAAAEYPALTALGRYCVALARYMQSPVHEYASLGRDIISINFDLDQRYLPELRLMQALETAMVDVVNMVGIEINEAVGSNYQAALLPYVAGLGPRKAQHLIKAIRNNGGGLVNREDLITNEGKQEDWIVPLGGKCYTNCAPVMRIPYDHETDEIEPDILDSTRVHPEDYDLARKICADALGLDEEDIEQEQHDRGQSACVRKIMADDVRGQIEELQVGDYAAELWRRFKAKKQGALAMIQSEIQEPYEELRNHFEDALRTDEIFTMFTGETKETLTEGMVVPMLVRKVGDDFVEGRLDCGIEATVESGDLSETGQSAKTLFAPMTTIRGKILSIDKRKLKVRMTVIEAELRKPFRKTQDRYPDEWDISQEAKDKEKTKVQNDVSGRTQRVINHPLFKPFSSAQAEEYLGSQSVGSVVIRPSSRGTDHLVVTWKVSDGVYKHIDVLELDKENEFSVGRTLKIDGKFTYSDLDELIVNHVNAMARKVDEMTVADKFQRGSKADTDRWLTTYLEANPKRSTYAFCINTKAPGYFHLCFKESQSQPVRDWPVKIVPGAFELQTYQYPDIRSLANGFKTLYQNFQRGRQARR